MTCLIACQNSSRLYLKILD